MDFSGETDKSSVKKTYALGPITLVYSGETGKSSLNNIYVFHKITDVNAIGGRYFRIVGSNDLFDVKSILKESAVEKFTNHEEITEDDIKPEFIYDHESNLESVYNILQLINGKTISVEEKIKVKHDGKIVQIYPFLYNRLGTKDEVGVEEQQYYTSKNSETGETTFLKKEVITPPAFKELADDEIRLKIASDGKSLFDGAIVEFPMIKYSDTEGKLHYVRDAKVQYILNPDTNMFDAKITRGSLGKVVATVPNVRAHIGSATFSASNKIRVRSRFINGINDQYAMYNEDGTVLASIDIDKPQTEDKKIRIHHKVDGRVRDIVITNNSIKIGNFSCPLKSASVNFEPDEKNFGNLVLNIDLLSIENAVIQDGKLVGLKNKDKIRYLDRLPFGIKLGGVINYPKTENSVSVYKESRIFENIDEESVVVADVIQTGAVNEKGECLVYDIVERERLFKDFKSNLEELKKLSNQGLTSADDLARIKKLKALIDEQLDKLGDHEAARDIQAKKKKLDELKNKPESERNQTEIDLAQQEYDNAVANAKLGYYKDSTNLATIDDVISKYQQGEFFETFYFNENGEKIVIKSGDITTITSSLPYDWSKSKAVGSIIGKDKVTIDTKTGKFNVEMSAGAKEVAVVSAKIAGVAMNLSFTGGPLSLLFMPFGVAIATAAITVSGATVLAETIRTKVKQAKFNKLIPDKLKEMQDAELMKCIEKEFAEAYEKYKEDIAHAERNFTDDIDLDNRKQEAYNNFLARRKAIYNQYMLVAPGVMKSKCTSKDKKLTSENLYGALERHRLIEQAKHGEDYDFDTKEKLRTMKEDKKKELEAIEYLGVGSATYKKKKEQIDAKYDNIKYEFLAEHGPLKKRVHYLKKTEKYFKATKEEREEMVKTCQEACDNFIKKLEVENVTVEGREGLSMDMFKNSILTIARNYIPDKTPYGTSFNDEANLEMGELKVPISVSVEEKELGKPHPDKSEDAVRVNECIGTLATTMEKCEEAIANTEKIPEIADELYDAQTEVDDKIKEVLGEKLAKSVLEDEEMWYDATSSKSKVRQLKDFVELLEKTYNTEETRNRYLSEKYDELMQAKMKQKLIDLKTEFKDDKEMEDVFTPSSLKSIKKYCEKFIKTESKYGNKEAGFYEKLDNVITKGEQDGKKKESILDLYKNAKEHEKKNLTKYVKEKQNELFAWINTATEEELNKNDALIKAITNVDVESITLEEFNKLYKKFLQVSKTSGRVI